MLNYNGKLSRCKQRWPDSLISSFTFFRDNRKISHQTVFTVNLELLAILSVIYKAITNNGKKVANMKILLYGLATCFVTALVVL